MRSSLVCVWKQSRFSGFQDAIPGFRGDHGKITQISTEVKGKNIYQVELACTNWSDSSPDIRTIWNATGQLICSDENFLLKLISSGRII